MFKIANRFWYCKLILTLTIIAGGYSLNAAEIQTGKEVTIDGKFNEDVYVAAGKLTGTSSVMGDASLIGGEITITSNVSGDLNIIGGQVKVTSQVGDDLHLIGGEVSISGTINGDVFVAGGNLVIEKNTTIKGDLFIAGGEVQTYGTIDGSVVIAAGKVKLGGSVGQVLNLKGGDTLVTGTVHGDTILSSKVLKIEPNARFHSNVKYWSKSEVNFGETLVNDKAEYDIELKQTMEPPYKFIFIMMLIALASSALTIFILNRFFGSYLKESSEYLRGNFLTGFGMGALYFIVFPVIILILAITLIGFPFSVVFGFAYTTIFIFARPISAIMATYWLQNRLKKDWSRGRFFITGYGIYLVIVITGFIPIVGWLATAIFVAACIGSGIQVLRKRQK